MEEKSDTSSDIIMTIISTFMLPYRRMMKPNSGGRANNKQKIL